MNATGVSSRPQCPLRAFDAEPSVGSIKPSVVRASLILAVLGGLLLAVPHPVSAQTETVLWRFTNGSDGGAPSGGLASDEKGNFYGTTTVGGLSGLWNGTVFELSPNGSGGWDETVLYNFTGGADGAYPFAPVIFDSAGNLYGTASAGGAHGKGVVFELSPVEAGWSETVLYSFAGGAEDGANPRNGLILDHAGNLFGTTWGGGSDGFGVVFELLHSPSGSWTEQVICGTCDPQTGVTMDASGNFFGVGGSTVFELSPNDTGGWDLSVIHTFTGTPNDGTAAYGTLVFDKAGNLYGTTYLGGTHNMGTVYRMTLIPGSCGGPKPLAACRHSGPQPARWTEEVLYSFEPGTVGYNPYAGITLDAAGNIYGTTASGGAHLAGTVFELAFPGNHHVKVLWGFDGTDGEEPAGSLILDRAGNLFDTAGGGIASYTGVVFELTLQEPAWPW